MKKYTITYYNKHRKTITRIAEDAPKAIEKLADQYGWNFRINMVDADTNGKDWCTGQIDPDGGINYNLFFIVKGRD